MRAVRLCTSTWGLRSTEDSWFTHHFFALSWAFKPPGDTQFLPESCSGTGYKTGFSCEAECVLFLYHNGVIKTKVLT